MGTNTSEAGILSGCSGETHMNGTKKILSELDFLKEFAHDGSQSENKQRNIETVSVQTVTSFCTKI
jgi:hypothetical protein